MIVKNDRLNMFKLYYRGISTMGLHATSSSSLISCVVVVVGCLLLLVCFHRYRVVVVVGFSPFENKAGPTDGRTTRRAYGLTDTYIDCLLYTSPSPRDATLSRMPSSA